MYAFPPPFIESKKSILYGVFLSKSAQETAGG